MKYVISDQNEVSIGVGYHTELARGFSGRVVAAGHCERRPDGTYRVWGESFGYGIRSKSIDALKLRQLEKEKVTNE